MEASLLESMIEHLDLVLGNLEKLYLSLSD